MSIGGVLGMLDVSITCSFKYPAFNSMSLFSCSLDRNNITLYSFQCSIPWNDNWRRAYDTVLNINSLISSRFATALKNRTLQRPL